MLADAAIVGALHRIIFTFCAVLLTVSSECATCKGNGASKGGGW